MVVLGLLASVIVGAAVGVALRRVLRRSWLRRISATEVVVHTTAGETIRGVLSLVAEDGLVLAAARHVGESGRTVPMKGDVLVPTDRILLVQTGIIPKEDL